MKDVEKIDWNDVIDYNTVSMLVKFTFLSEEDDIRSAASEGAWQAFLVFDSSKSKNIDKHVKINGYYKTIDILRREKLLTKPTYLNYRIKTYNQSDEFVLDYSFIGAKNYKNFDKMWFELTDGLGDIYIKALYMRYVEKRTIEEMEEMLKIHRSLVRKRIFYARKKICRLQSVSDKNIEMFGD